MFNGTNFVAWRARVLKDAHVLGALNILRNHDLHAPLDLSSFESQFWEVRNSLLHTQIFRSSTTAVKQTLGFHLMAVPLALSGNRSHLNKAFPWPKSVCQSCVIWSS